MTAASTCYTLIEFKRQDIGLAVYPNPTEGKFTVSSRQGAIKKVEVFDLFGRLLLRSNKPEIDMSGFPEGMYFVQVNEVVQKVILQ